MKIKKHSNFASILLLISTSAVCQEADFSIAEDTLSLETADLSTQLEPMSNNDAAQPRNPLITGTLKQAIKPQDKNEVVTNRMIVSVNWNKPLNDACSCLFDIATVGTWYLNDDQQAAFNNDSAYVKNRVQSAYFQYNHDEWNIRLGYQAVAWGQAEALPVTDILSPRNNIDFVFSEQSESRLGQPMVNINWFGNNQQGSFYFIAPTSDEQPDEASPFFPLMQPLPDTAVQDSEDLGVEKPEIAYRHTLFLNNIDIHLMAGLLRSNEPFFSSRNTVIRKEFPQFRFWGIAGSYNVKDWLFRAELAYKPDFPEMVNSQEAITLQSRKRGDAMIGFDYTLHDDWVLTMEGNYLRYWNQQVGDATTEEENAALYLGIAKSFAYQQGKASLEWTHLDQEKSDYISGKISYSLTQKLNGSIEWGELKTTNESEIFQQLDKEDRFSVALTYIF